ncbi:hypothetical protein LCGC14_2558670 [marine sediment metagenome]|uniref:Uncharacterized protein n=1 Tax=marine sediment metagenome TaxID=412755 RepID=A0A0F9AKN1_9ZZZZ
MRRLSIRKRGPASFEVGPNGHGPTVMVGAMNKANALKKARALLTERGQLHEASAQSFRDNPRNKTRPLAVI